MAKSIENGKKVVDTDFPEEDKFEHLPAAPKTKRAPSAFLTVQEGCDKFCAFCVVPFTRGAEVSRPVLQIINEARDLVERGVRDITLLGQNVNAYHGAMKSGDANLPQLIKELSKIEELKRIRFTTSHPNDMTQELIDAHGEMEKLMPYLHLPVQSGSDKILKGMNRKHTAKSYLEVIENLRVARPDIALSGDFIVGFPGETEKDFQETLNLIDYVQFKQSYSFIYSERPGTKAATIEDITPIEEKKNRLSILQKKLEGIQLKFNTSFCNTNISNVLIENQSQSNPEYYFGRSTFLQPVYVKAKNLVVGDIVPIGIETCNHKSLYGTISH